MKRPTIKDVAAHAGVSKSTVSLVLQKSSLVKDDTRRAVEEAMEALNYVRNRAAATLRGSSTGLIGLVINDLRNPFFTEFAASVQEALMARGYAMVIANADENAATQTTIIRSMLEHEVSGLIISPVYGDGAAGFEAIERAGIPALQVLRKLESGAERLPFFSHDYREGGRLAAQHLVDTGAKNIVFVGGIEGRQITAERRAGVEEVLKAENLTLGALPGRPTRAFGRAAADVLVDSGFDAAICFNDLVALGLHAGLTVRGIDIGRELRLVGFDDIEEAALTAPPLSSVHCDVARFGAEAAAMLLGWMRDGTAPQGETRLPVRLNVRATSGG